MTIDWVIFIAVVAVITSYMAFLEVRWQRSSDERNAMHTRISLLETTICTSDNVRQIIRDENACVITSLAKLTDRVEALVTSTHKMQLTMAERRADDKPHED